MAVCSPIAFRKAVATCGCSGSGGQEKEGKEEAYAPSNSAIIFDIPDLDDTEVDKLMEEMTQARYDASVNAKAGKLGKGGGKKGGWPEGWRIQVGSSV